MKTGITSKGSPNSRKVLLRKSFQLFSSLSRVIDGVTYPGIVQDKAAAQEQYQAAVGRGESAGLVK